MLVFISWSGTRSHKAAEALKDWLGDVIQAVEPWVSTDIEKGKRWTEEVSGILETATVGIICLTRDNLNSNWIQYEAGALSKSKLSHACTFLLDIKPGDVEFPLAQFQHTLFNEDDILKLLQCINKSLGEIDERSLPEDRLKRNFLRLWPDLEKKLNEAANLPAQAPSPIRKPEEMLYEALDLLRGQTDKINALERRFESLTSSPQDVQGATSRAETPLINRTRHFTTNTVTAKTGESDDSETDVFSDGSASEKPSPRLGRRIHDLEEFIELWPRVLLRIRKKIGVTAVAYLYDASPLELNTRDAVIGFSKEFHYAKACEAAKRLPFEQVLNECFATPHQLKFTLKENSSDSGTADSVE